MSHAFTTEPGDGWRNLLRQVYGDWQVVERDLFGHTARFFEGTQDDLKVSELAHSVRTDLEVGQRVTTFTRVGHCCSHSSIGSCLDSLPPGITGTIQKIGVQTSYYHNRPEPRAHVVVEMDPETIPGRHRFILCLPPAPLVVISDAQRDAALYGGLFSAGKAD